MAPLARDGEDAILQIVVFLIMSGIVMVVALCGRLCGCMNSKEAAACVDDGIGNACLTFALV